jgi:hypothetical protein
MARWRSRRRWIFLLATAVVLVPLCLFMVDCWLSLRFKERALAVRVGDNRETVLRLLGEPTQRFPSPGLLTVVDPSERWVYGPRFISWTKSGWPRLVLRLFDKPYAEDIVIKFRKDGTVDRVIVP